MNKGLNIHGDEIEFNSWSVGDIHSTCLTKSFKIKFQDIKLIGISPRLSIDDEILLITIIDKESKLKQFSSYEFEKEYIKLFERKLNLNSIKLHEWEKFSWKDHMSSLTDKVIYPKELYWQDLFHIPKGLSKLTTQLLKFLGIKQLVSGKYSTIVNNYLNNCE